jgi:NAD(P)-dependent dehydrogenase (short-subunit alcohol dehydrogenase family)
LGRAHYAAADDVIDAIEATLTAAVDWSTGQPRDVPSRSCAYQTCWSTARGRRGERAAALTQPEISSVTRVAFSVEPSTKAVGEHDDLLAVDLDVTDPTAAQAAVAATIKRFGRLDVLVNNAGNFQAGFFEEMTPEAFRSQIETTLFGPVNITRATLPQLRAQRSGLVMTISSTAGITSPVEFTTAYATSKFGVEGFMEALTSEVAPFGIKTMLVEPGFFSTELLSPQSTQYAEPSIEDYAERTTATMQAWKGMDGKQGGDPAKLADALIELAALEEPPVRFAAGADAVATFEQKANELLARADAHRELSTNLAHDDA